MPEPIEIEGYAALFGVADEARDVVYAGAFVKCMAARTTPLPMLVQHEQKLLAGVWRDVREDRRGLFVRGAIDPAAPGAARALRALQAGWDGLSIGFIARAAEARAGGGRGLFEIDLLEVSIVAFPMQPLARLNLVRELARAA